LRFHVVTGVTAGADLDVAIGHVPSAWSRPTTQSLPFVDGDPWADWFRPSRWLRIERDVPSAHCHRLRSRPAARRAP
jgi:hypothetical protein